jgi:hypothetical protein
MIVGLFHPPITKPGREKKDSEILNLPGVD